VLAAIPIAFVLNAYNGVGSAALQLITPSHMRAQFTAIMLFFANLFGLALGPTSVAFMTDFVFQDDQALRYSLAILPILVCPVAIFLLVQGLKPYCKAVLVPD
jgi:MFS family permease